MPGSRCTTKIKVKKTDKEPGNDLYRLADNLSVHFFGNKADYIYETEIDRKLYETELNSVKAGLGKALEGKPEELQNKMIRGKFMKFLQEKSMENQPVGFEESDLTISEYITRAEKKVGKVKITSAQRFGV